MSGIHQWPVTATARLHCDAHRCDATWVSPVYETGRFDSYVTAAAPALAQGWRVYVGARSQHTYCPTHGPKTAMRLVYGPERES